MTSDKMKGKSKEIIGASKEKLGEMTGDDQLQAGLEPEDGREGSEGCWPGKG